MSRFTGTFNLFDVNEVQRVVPSMSDRQLVFTLNCVKATPKELSQQRAIIIDEISNRVVGVYQKKWGH